MNPTDIIRLPDQGNTHEHDYHQLVVVLDGNTDFDINGNDKQLQVGQGCLVPSSEYHAFKGLGENSVMLVNLPTPSEKAITDEEYEVVSRLFDQAAYFQLNPRLQVLASALSGELQQYPEDKMLARACGNTLLSSIRHQLSTAHSAKPKGNQLDIDQLDQFIELNLSRKVHINQLANFCFLSVSQFHERFKEKTGITPHQYLMRKRIERAQALLVEGFTPINVAEMCGFSSQSAMTSLFTQILGITPIKFQKQLR
ncbi:AraC family transcriptional regulator [Marinomonas sp. 2405UD68-3]|uniref:AraC family transcriptional regulator n=1 Tax=Marinomonas sp. 2405UD68-3 TaxID=3391835 RepID=UPI0039C905CA